MQLNIHCCCCWFLWFLVNEDALSRVQLLHVCPNRASPLRLSSPPPPAAFMPQLPTSTRPWLAVRHIHQGSGFHGGGGLSAGGRGPPPPFPQRPVHLLCGGCTRAPPRPGPRPSQRRTRPRRPPQPRTGAAQRWGTSQPMAKHNSTHTQ